MNLFLTESTLGRNYFITLYNPDIKYFLRLAEESYNNAQRRKERKRTHYMCYINTLRPKVAAPRITLHLEYYISNNTSPQQTQYPAEYSRVFVEKD